MTRASELRAAIARSRARVTYAERELARLMLSKCDARYGRSRRKLSDDLALARSDVAVLERALAEENARPPQDYIEKANFLENVDNDNHQN